MARFATFSRAYEEATAKWRKEHRAWQDRRIEAVKADVAAGVDKRFQDDAAQRAQAAVITTMANTIDGVRAGKAHWNERAKNVEGLQSAWYDPKTHGPNPTPFLSDLTISRTSRGDKEGRRISLLAWRRYGLRTAARRSSPDSSPPGRPRARSIPGAAAQPLRRRRGVGV
jgi:hypothetical protein